MKVYKRSEGFNKRLYRKGSGARAEFLVLGEWVKSAWTNIELESPEFNLIGNNFRLK